MTKTFKTLALSIIFLLSLNAVAQYPGGGYGGGYGGMNGTSGNMSGMRGGMNGMGSPMGSPGKTQTAPTEKEKAEKIDKIMEKFKKDLNLDELQMFAIRNEVVANSKSMEAIMKSENSNDDKGKEAEAVNEKTDRIINTYLNKEQKEKYKVLIDERKKRIEEYKNRR
ncbi:hypothetical protein OX284_008495 [Flavobacterium sp. SUN046]|jgi:hypothetical protein|uniref:hypothetical protein n=1 Tax=Flavobacterium sp. SUN046 TaxID=3002440 RepID=UPI002DBFDC27|nr:hypothetical protein [Flavobacterium sp. SUN046]MEC4049467.1 hypothetical protein [Flavobacterium sp. SUN046]